MFFFFFFNDTATTEIYTLSLHDALPISRLSARTTRSPETLGSLGMSVGNFDGRPERGTVHGALFRHSPGDRKSTRLNSSHGYISYAVFCLKKKNIFDYTSL